MRIASWIASKSYFRRNSRNQSAPDDEPGTDTSFVVREVLMTANLNAFEKSLRIIAIHRLFRAVFRRRQIIS